MDDREVWALLLGRLLALGTLVRDVEARVKSIQRDVERALDGGIADEVKEVEDV